MQSLRSMLSATLLAGLWLGASAIAGAADTVKVGSESKPASGKLIAATAGDVACYLDFEDAKGDRFSEMAEFELCEDEALHGQWVKIGYTIGSVLADSCQGNPDCGESQQVALVNSLQAAERGAGSTAEPASKTGAGAVNHCAATETVMFNCAIGSRVLSVCANDAARLTQVEYRYGKPGQELEMRLPKKAGVPNVAVYGRTDSVSGGGGSWIRFRNANVAYVVYDGFGRWGEDGATMEKNGVAIEQNGKLLNNLKCDDRPINNLSPEFFERMGADPAAADEFYFPE